MLYIIYDNSFNGFLTAVFDAFYLHRTDICILSDRVESPLLFDCRTVCTDYDKSFRVQSSIDKKLGEQTLSLIWTAWLSHESSIEDLLLSYLRLAFKLGADISKMSQNSVVFKVVSTSERVKKEAHRFKEFVRFKKYKEVYVSDIYPDFEILPLIEEHFCNRFNDQNFIIRDRHYCKALIYYNKKPVIMDMSEFFDPEDMCDDEFEDMWRKYYSAMCIESRKSRRRMLSLMPLKYHRYITESQPVYPTNHYKNDV